MLRDYIQVEKYFQRLDAYAYSVTGKHFYDMEYTGYSAPTDFLKNSEFYKRYREFLSKVGELQGDEDGVSKLVSLYFPDLRVDRTVDEMSIDDMMNVLTLLSIKQYNKRIIVRYDEIGYFNNKTLSGDAFTAYNAFLTECRSPVIDLRTMKIVSLPFYKFRNMGECEQYSLDNILKRLQRAKIVEFADKLDGSFIQITYSDSLYDGHNYILTSSKNLDEVVSPVIKYAREFYEKNKSYQRMISDHRDYTFVFELISKYDCHVVSYSPEDNGLYLVGARHKVTGELVSYAKVISLADEYGIKHTTVASGTFDEIRATLDKYKSHEKEGYVINIDGFLVKLKCDAYVSVSRVYDLKSSFNTVIELYAKGQIDDLVAKLDGNLLNMVNDYIKEIDLYMNLMDRAVTIETEKLFNNPEIDIRNASTYLKALPRLFRGYVQNNYYNTMKGFQPVNYYLYNSNHGIQVSYITGKELRRRTTELKKYFGIQ